MFDIDKEWESFMGGNEIEEVVRDVEPIGEMPEPSEIYISTQSKLGFLNSAIDIKTTFWDIPITPYWKPEEGILKKQIKFVSSNMEELESIQEKLSQYECKEQQVITHINNPEGKIKFKDIRKLSIGISKKDILNYHSRKKSAFYNCFVIIMRIKYTEFREVHVKIFNTGKIEIPGIQSNEMYIYVLEKLVEILRKHCNMPEVTYNVSSETILINSNFSVGFYIDREVLYKILRTKYHIECVYDPCSYPGIQCKYYFEKELVDCEDDEQIRGITGMHTSDDLISVSFMIFRTGSVLIVGKCNGKILMHIYEYLKEIFKAEYLNIVQTETIVVKEKTKKVRKKTIYVN